eukprot:492400-Prymnesium_polylepis.1
MLRSAGASGCSGGALGGDANGDANGARPPRAFSLPSLPSAGVAPSRLTRATATAGAGVTAPPSAALSSS